MFTGTERTLDLPVTPQQLADWEAGTLIQRAMPQLTASEREFIKTGVTAAEWDNEFGPNDMSFDPEPVGDMGMFED